MYRQPVTYPGVGAIRISQGDCQDCKKEVDTFSVPGDIIVVHSDRACQAFRDRFTATEACPVVTKAYDERGWKSWMEAEAEPEPEAEPKR